MPRPPPNHRPPPYPQPPCPRPPGPPRRPVPRLERSAGPPAHRAGPVGEHGKGGERGHGGRPQPGAGPAVHGGEGRRADDPRADVEQQPRSRRQSRPGDPGPPSLGPYRPLERVPPAADVAGTAFGEGLERRPTSTGQRPGAGQDQPLGPGQAGPRGEDAGTSHHSRPVGDREIAVGGKIEDRGRVCGTIQPASGHAQVSSAGFAAPAPAQAPRRPPAGPSGLVTTEHQPNTSSHAAAAVIASTSTIRVSTPTGAVAFSTAAGARQRRSAY